MHFYSSCILIVFGFNIKCILGLCINMITGSKYNPVSGDKILFTSQTVYHFDRMHCFQSFVMRLLRNCDAKIISHLQNSFSLFKYFPLFLPKYYIISLSGDGCLKRKEANIQNLYEWNFHLKLNLAFFFFFFYKLSEVKKTKNLCLLKHVCHSGRVVIDPDAGRSRRDHCSEMERMCAARVKDKGMMRL